MRLDHLSYAVNPDGLEETANRLANTLGVEPIDGGYHPRFGTRNIIMGLRDMRYIEVVEVLEHPAADKAPFGQAVRARSEMGGGWMGWVVSAKDLSDLERRLERDAVPGNRRRPDGVELSWKQIGIKGLIADPQLPYLIQWEGPAELHPAYGSQESPVGINTVTIAGDPERVREWLGLGQEYLPQVNYDFVAPNGSPGILKVSFDTPTGTIEI